MPSPSSLRRAAAASLMAFLVSACGEALEEPAAVVNGTEISVATVKDQLDSLLANPQYAEQVTGTGGEERKRTFTRQLLSFLIQQELIEEYARAKGIQVSSREIERELTLASQQAGGEEQLEQQLRERGLTLADVRDNIARNLLLRKVQDAVTEERLGQQALREEYRSRSLELTTVSVANIVLPTKKEAQAVRRQATKANFLSLARRLWRQKRTVLRGGDMGDQSASRLPIPIARAAMRLRPGQISRPVETDAGWQVLWLREKRMIPFEQVKPDLLASYRDREFSDWLRERLSRANVDVSPRFGRFDPRTGEVSPITSTAQLG